MLRFLKYLTQKDIKPMGDQLLENNIPKSLQKMIRLIKIPKFDTNSKTTLKCIDRRNPKISNFDQNYKNRKHAKFLQKI